MKKTLTILLTSLLLLVAACGIADNNTEFSVTGHGVVRLQPDIVTLYATAQAYAETVSEAQRIVGDATTKATDALIALGIDPEDIVTSYYNFYPNFNYDVNPAVVNGYNANHSITITFSDIALLDSIVSALTEAGFPILDSVEFGVSDKTAAYRDALALAVEDAKAKAETLANVLGAKDLHIEEIQEIESYSYVGARTKYSAANAEDAVATGIRNGSIDVNASVNVKFKAE